MEVHRIGGIKYNFDRLTNDELENIHGNLLSQHQRVTDEIGLVEATLFARNHVAQGLGSSALEDTVEMQLDFELPDYGE